MQSKACPKLADLRAQGPAARDVAVLFTQHDTPLPCPYSTVFRPNADYLHSLLSGVQFVRKPSEPAGLMRLGRLACNQPAAMALLLCRTPALFAELEAWGRGELGVTRAQLGQDALVDPAILRLPLGNAKEVAGYRRGAGHGAGPGGQAAAASAQGVQYQAFHAAGQSSWD